MLFSNIGSSTEKGTIPIQELRPIVEDRYLTKAPDSLSVIFHKLLPA